MLLLVYFFAIGSIGLIIFYLVKPDKEAHLPQHVINAGTREKAREPFFLAVLLGPLNKVLFGKKMEQIRQKLIAAELNILPEELLSIQEIMMVVLPISLYIIGMGKIESFWMFVAGGIGFILPDFYIRSRINKRRGEIIKQLPDILDIFFLVVSAGLDFMTALKWILERSKPSPLISEFSAVLREINVGKSREQALKDMARRLDIPEMSSVVRTVVQGERMGTPMAEIIKLLSDDIRRQRFERGQRIALKAPIKILFPLICFIMPVVGI
ncbi:type II secretion system F family protein, partial [bacterium]